MLNVEPGAETKLDYQLCRYGRSRVLVRGPKRALKGPYFAVLGGTEAFGKFVEMPVADRIEGALGIPVANLSGPNFGLDTFLEDKAILDIASSGLAAIVQVTGAQNLSNPFYKVHPRRNDRVLTPSEDLRDLYPELDFTETHFARHLLTTLMQCCPRRFAVVEAALRATWLSRAGALLEALDCPTILLWMAARRPEDDWDLECADDPLFVDRGALEELSSKTAGLIDVAHIEREGDPARRGMVFSALERPLAAQLPGPEAHRGAAERLIHLLTPIRIAAQATPTERRRRRRA